MIGPRLYHCVDCGSTDVQYFASLDVNTDEVFDPEYIEYKCSWCGCETKPCYGDSDHCEVCSGHLHLMDDRWSCEYCNISYEGRDEAKPCDCCGGCHRCSPGLRGEFKCSRCSGKAIWEWKR